MKLQKVSLVVLSCLFFAVSAFAGEVTFRKATPEDLVGVQALIQGFNEEDRARLVVYPEVIAKGALLSAIQEGMFLAFDSDTGLNVPISMLRLYFIPQEQVLDKLKEVRAVGADRRLVLAESFNGSTERKAFFESRKEVPLEDQDFTSQAQRRFIYYGGAFTDHAHRNQYINGRLLSYGVQSLAGKIAEFKESEAAVGGRLQMIMLYGQVKENLSNKGMIFDFVKALESVGIGLEPEVLHLGYFAIKPTLVFDEVNQEVKAVFLQEGEGQGSLVIFNLLK